MRKPASYFTIPHFCPTFFLLIAYLLVTLRASAQTDIRDTSKLAYKEVIPGKEYAAGSFHRWMLGAHYRNEWTTKVRVKVINLDSTFGGLTPTEQGGGRQTQTLRLKNPNGKEYVLRSIDKTYGKALPEIVQGTFIENLANDQVSSAHPFAPITIPVMAEAAGVYHTNPEIVFVPEQPALGEYNQTFANMLGLLEERPDDNQEDAPNFGSSKKVVSTEKMFENIFGDNDRRVDQVAFVRARLFDMFVGDWGRHEDQWRWASFENDNKTIYKPIPRDRDQTYTRFDGVLPSVLLPSQLQTFGYDIKDLEKYNFPADFLDRKLANEASGEIWINQAKELQQALTDPIIEKAIHQLPPELFKISGEEIIAKLKSRREHLVEYATEYYKFLALEVDITGTKDREWFAIKRLNDEETEVNIFKINSRNEVKSEPFYSRTFLSSETHELRVYGLEGDDVFVVDGKTNNGIKIRIIGGPGKDTLNDQSSAGGAGHNISVYDTPENTFHTSGEKLHISENPFINYYNYKGFEYDSKGIKPSFFYNSDDHFYTGLKYVLKRQQWRKYPFGFNRVISIRYSISEKAFSTQYKGLFTQLIGKWNLGLNANYDFMRWNNFFGIGNETVMTTKQRNYHRARTRDFNVNVGLNRNFLLYNYIGFSLFYQTVKVINDKDRFISDHFNNQSIYNTKKFGGAKFEYSFQKLNNLLLPTKGINFLSSITYTQNLRQKDSSTTNYSSSVDFFIPLSKSVGLHIRPGVATLTGKPQFYQLNKLGGNNLRGYRRFRFYGKTFFFDQNELQWIRNVKTHFYSGKAGLLAVADAGRVWQPGEKSNTIHAGFGGGIILAPFNKISAAITYARSSEEGTFNVRINSFLR